MSTAAAGQPFRVGMVFVGNSEDPRSFSGTPAGISGGLREWGVEVTPINIGIARVPELTRRYLLALGRLRRTDPAPARVRLQQAVQSAIYDRSRWRDLSQAAARRLPLTPTDAFLQVSTDLVLRAGGVPVTTLEDMTFAQARQHDYSWLRPVPAEILDERERTLAAVYAAAQGCCALTSWAARSMVNEYGVPPDRTHVVGVGSSMPPSDAPRDWSQPHFLFVGIDWQRKNGAAVVRAFSRLRQHHPKARLDLVGDHPAIDEPGVSGYGVLSPVRPTDRARLQRLFDQATCLVVPSLLEPAGIVYTEALAAGVPVIGTTEGGGRDLIGDAGLVVDPTDESALLGAMDLVASPEHAKRFAAAARARRALFTWKAVSGRVLRAIAPQLAEPLDLPAMLPRGDADG